jgi:hypothetical protein
MRPVRFEHCNTTLTGEGCGVLPALKTDDGYFVSKWRLSLPERIRALICGHVWLSVKSDGHPPVMMMARKPYFFKTEA